jgi:hypothetical protein
MIRRSSLPRPMFRSMGIASLILVFAAPPAFAEQSPSPSPTSSTASVPAPTVRRTWQEGWNTVKIDVQSQAPHWTVRPCPTAQDPGLFHAEGSGSEVVTVVLAKTFSWDLVDDPPLTTFCAEVVADDGAGGTSSPSRASAEVDFAPRVTGMTFDTWCPWDREPAVRAGSMARPRFRAYQSVHMPENRYKDFPVPGVVVEARMKLRGSTTWTGLGEFTTDSQGFFHIEYRHDTTTDIELCRPGSGCGNPLESRRYGTFAAVYASSVKSVARNRTFPVYGTVLPRYAGRPVHLCQRVTSTSCTVLEVKKTDAQGRVVFAVRSGTQPGYRSFKLLSPYHNQIAGNTWGEVPVVTVRVL